MLKFRIQMWLGIESTEMNATKKDGKGDAVNMQHAASYSAIHHLKQIRSYHRESLAIIADIFKTRVVVQHRVENIQEEMERILIEEVDLIQRVQCEIDVAASLR